MQKTMSRMTWNIIVGLVVAAGLSIGTAQVSAFECFAAVQCGGFQVSCECWGAGSCEDDGSVARCACVGLGTEICDCDQGCRPVA